MSRGKLLLMVGLATVLALLAAACGSDDSSEGTEEELIETVESFYASMYDADFEAVYDQMSEACQDFRTLEEQTELLEDATFGLEQATGADLSGLEIVDLEVVEFEESESALVTFDIVHAEEEGFDPEVVNETTWVYENGWKWDGGQTGALLQQSC